jgi:hypothetical protein
VKDLLLSLPPPSAKTKEINIKLAPASRPKVQNGRGSITGHGFSRAARAHFLMGWALEAAEKGLILIFGRRGILQGLKPSFILGHFRPD